MHIAGHAFDIMSASEVDMIHQGALRILAEMGMEIQNQKLLTACADHGLKVDFSDQRVRFQAPLVEKFLSESDKTDWEKVDLSISATSGVYHSLYHDPDSGQLLPWTEENLTFYFALSRAMQNIGNAVMLGCRLPVPSQLEPLYERYYCWKYGAMEGGSIYLDEICPYLFDLYQIYADYQHKPLTDIFHGTVYLIPAMKLGIHEAYQVEYYWEKGLHVGIGDMYAMGANTPVTVAGAVTLNLAEQIALGILKSVLYGENQFHLGVSIAPMDMRTMIYPFGRPESVIANLMTAQLARHYKVSYFGHAGLTSAKMPSVEVGYQKASSAVPTLMVGGNLWMDAGLLAMDEVVSPIQLILDNEFLSFLHRFVFEYEINQDTLAIDMIIEAGPAGTYIDNPHTSSHFRKELWEPIIWNRRMLNNWLETGKKLDIDKAKEIALDIRKKANSYSGLEEDLERYLLAIINRAKSALVD